jgi:CheY-like chemotaxis protein
MQSAHNAGHPFNVALLDFVMPRMDGLELTTNIKRHPELTNTALIAMTSASQRSAAEACIAAGCCTFLMKPLVRPAQLLDVLRSAWRGSQPSVTDEPIPDEDGTAKLPALEESADERGQIRVLVAEDNAVNRLLVTRMFTKLGYRIDLAANGREAVEMATRLHYDIIFMDCFMPELDGYGASRALRQLEQGDRRVPIVALTANAMADDRAKCLAAGMDDYLSKPVGLEEIRNAMQRWVHDVPAARPDSTSSAA